jgi:hypothetical protein
MDKRLGRRQPGHCGVHKNFFALPGIESRPSSSEAFAISTGYVGFVVDKVALGQVFSEYFGFPCQSSFH